jgi:hypothetical protein
VTHPELVKQVADLHQTVSLLVRHSLGLHAELDRLRGTIVAAAAVAATAVPDDEDPLVVALAAAEAAMQIHQTELAPVSSSVR